MNVCCITLAGQSETEHLGDVIGTILEPGDLLYLDGDLGTGKTTLTKSIAKSRGIAPEAVTSPTFTLVHEYRANGIVLYHFDLYRLASSAELDNLGFDDYIDGSGIVVIEWASKAIDRLPGEAVSIEIVAGSSPDDRLAQIRGYGDRSTSIVEQLKRIYSC